MARERSLLALLLVCVLVHASHHFALGQTTMAEIVISPEAQTDVQIGDTVLFTCVAFGDSVSTISWSRGGNALLNDSQRITIYEEEFAEGGVTFVQSILEICSVGLGDTTEGYSCSAGSGADIDSATFELNTQQIVIYPEDTEMIAGDTVLLTCVSYLSPVTWSREGVELVNDSMRITVYQEQFVESELSFYLSILEICSTESSDSGTYSCNADEGDGANSSISFQLTVQTPPQIVLYPVDPTDVPVGDTVLLTCVANGDLPLSISWSREGTVLMNDSQRITIYEEEIEEGGITFLQSILQICSIGSDDAGVYSCITENDASNDTASFELTVAGPPVQIVLHPVNLTDVPDGDTVLLTCVANGDLPLSISWSREGTVLMNDSQRITIYEEEIEEGGITFLQSILQICSARADDAGTYSCIAENEAGNDTANFQLTVVPPEVAVQIVLHPVDLTDVPDGDTVLLTCVANGDLPLSISWSREGTVLMNDSQRITIYEEEIEEGGITFIQSILQICSIGSDDAGVYNCIAENDASNDTASFELTVAGPPVQIVLNPVDPTNVPDGDTVLLTCVANGDLPLSISWSREGTVLMNDSQRITIYEEEIEEGGITFLQSILQICSARADDAGTYSCVAENEAGNDTANFELTVIPPEVAVQIVLHPMDPTNVPDGDTVLLTCVANGDLPLSISWSREGTVLMNDSQRITIYEEEIEEGGITFVQSVLQVCSIGTSDAGIYSCIAENGASNDTANFELTVAVPVVAVQIVLHPVDPTDVPVGDTVLLTCVANGDLPLSISWSREGTVLMNDSQRITIYDEEIEEGGITFVQSVLQICSAETDDAGSYSCNADNTAGNDTASFELTVSEDEFATVVIRPTDTEVVAGLTALLTCVGYGNPPVSITWRRFDTVLTNDTSPRITIYEQEIIEGGVVFVMSILQICSAEVADTGLASCTVDNGVANDTTEFQFTVEPAVPQLVITPENLTEVSSGNTVFLTCVALGELPLAFRWTREGSDLMNDTRVFVYDEAFEEGGSSFVQSILQICSTEEPDSGMYSCVAENEQGNATAVFELDVLVSPVIVIQPPPLTDVPDGNTILLTCVAYGELPLGISWSREGSLLMNDSQRIVIYKEEFEEGGITFVQSVIQICSAEVDDAGVYNCTAENEVDSVTASFELTVTPLVIPLQIVIQPEPTTDVVVGETVLFTCVATGDLPLSISWSREGSVLQNDSQRVAIYEEEFDENGIVFVQSILQICNTGTGDAGIYSCTAENETANITASFELTVSVEAQLVLVPPDSEVPSGDTILLTCVASGSLPLEVSWSREGSALMNDTRVVIYQEAFEESGLTFVRSILQLCSAETADSGTYSCTANNGFSNDSATFDLAVMEVTPQIVLIPPNTQVNATNTVLLTCVAYGGLPLGISWSREGSNLVNDSQRITIYEEQFEENGVTFVRSILQICSTEIDDSGVYSCTAENNAGNITSAFELAVTIPARVVALPNDTEVNAGDTLLLTCVGYSHPVGTIIWSRGSVDLANGTRTTIYEEEFEESGLTFVRSILQICSTEPSDAGLYTCTVDNGITDASSNFNVAVITQAPVIVLAPNDTIVTAGFSVALTCAAYGIPAPEISWTRQDLMGISLLEDTNTTNITSERFEEGGVTFVQSTLFLCSSEVLFTAELSCTAANSVGSDTEYFTVSVESAVTIVHNPEPTSGHVGQSASLTCTVMSSQSPSSFQWYRVGMEDPIAVGDRYEISRSDADSMYTSQLTISDLVPADGGEYFCEVVTFIHSVQFNVTTVSALLTILRVPVVEAVSVSPVLGIKGLSTTLQFSVSADALPPVTPANVEWRFNPISGPVVTLTESSSVRYTFSADMLSLTITGLVSADEGTYTLIASTIAGSDSAVIHMFVRVPARITTPPVNMQAHVGSSAAFTCVAEADPVPTFQWSFDGLTLADNDKYDITTTSTMSTLTVLEISSSDGGSYTCNATNDYGTNSASAELQVRSVPVVAAVSISPLIRAQNTSVTLQFSISDDLPPVTSTDVVWRFTPVGSSIMQTITSDGRYIFSDDTLSLTIGELVVSDEGSYTLEATTTAGSDSATIFLDVQTATVITTPPEDTQALVGRSATFTCVAEAEPTPTFQWEFEGSTVVASDKYSITATTSTVSTLTVLDISPSDDGAYTCNATNDHGSDFASADLQVLSVPVVAAVSSSPLIGTQETSVTLQFSISDDLPPVTSTDIVWRFTPVGSSTMQGITSDSNIRYTFSDDMLSLTIETLIATDEGSYTLEATNIAGSDSATIFLNVQTAVMITTPPEDTQGLIGSSATFTCVAEAEPAPTFQWSFESSTIVDDDKYDVTTTSTVSTLTVLNISPSDNGTYTCNATNDHGTDFASADLQVLSVPTVAFSNSPVIGALGTTVTLQFSLSDDLPPVISSGIVWQFTPVGSSAMQPITSSGRYTFSDDMLSLTIGTLIAVDEGSYTLEATTIAGSDSATIFLDVQTATVITAPPEDTQTLVGRSATFTCVAEAEPTPIFQWSFEGLTITDDDKYDITTTSTVSTLTVLEISLSDDGTYTCNATNDHGSDFASADLQALTVPVVTAVSSNPLIGAQNTSVTLQFSISNDLPPVTSTDVVWRFTPFGSSVMQTITSDGRYIFSDDMLSLAIEALIATDEGSYTLEATTIAGSDSATIVLDVQTATVITIPPEDTQALIGSSATFTCVAEAEPTPTFQWEFEGVVIMDVDRYDIDTTSTESALTISDVVASDDGTYTCSAENVHGRDFASANLQVLSIPVVSAVPQSPLIGILERNITLQFSEGNDLPPITPADIEWRFAPIGGSAITISSSPDSHYIFSDDKLSLTIIVLSLDDEGVYELMGTTIAGSTSANISLDVQVPARITAPPVYTEVIVGRSATLSCVVAAEPAPTFQWSFGGSALVESNKYEITVTNSTSTLTILDVSTSDDGVYTCGVTNVHGTDSASAELEVLVPPTVSVSGSGLLQATEGQTITLSFLIINSNPPVSPSGITWEFLFISDTAETVVIDDGTRYAFSPDRTSLTIANLGPMDSGTYTLTAINSAGSSATFIQLSVSVSPTIFEDSGDTSVLDVGEEVTFVCTADGVPLPTSIVWLKNNRLLQTEQNDRFKVVEEEVPPFQPYILSARRSTLVINDLRTSDGGTYSCSASNGIGTAVLPQAYGLTVTEPEPINFCASSPCQNGGTCSNLEANFVCMCPTGRDGLTCETRVTVSDPPVIVAGPLTLFVLPFTPAFLACTVSGTPQPVITWLKDGILIPREGSQTLVIPEPGLSDRGLYYCSATNSLGTVSSPPVYLNIIGIVQFLFSIRIDISALFPLRADGNLNEVEEKLVELLNQLDGASLGDNITLYSVETLEGATINPITGAVDIVITVFSDDGANTTVRTVDDEVLGELSVLLEDLGREQNITFTVTGMKRFDGCSAEATVIRSDSSSELDLRLQWPEMPIGAVASISCPCESTDIPRMATRICGGDFESGGQWEDPADNDCDFGDFTRRLCLVTGDPTSTIAAVAEITGDPTSFGALEISTTLELLEQLLTRATGNASLSNGLFDVIDNLLKVSPENLLESHERTNSSARLRAMLEHLADTYPLPSGLQDLRPSFTITRDTFAMRIHLVHPDTFTGDALSVMFQDSFYLVDAFQQNDLVTGIDEDAAAYISLPTSLFEGLNLGTDEARLVYDVYLKDTLFMRRSNYVEEQALVNEVGGMVMSGRISSGVQVSNLDEQVQLSFAKNPFSRSGINTQCSFWDQSLDEGYGAWSTEGCLRVRDSSGKTVCQCDHLTSFTILTEPAAVNEGLGSIVGLIGGPVCIFFLLLTVIKYLFISSLRSTTIGVFLFNICLALTVLYAFTIASFYTTSSEVLCAVFSSLFHWLFLVSALALTTAAMFRVWEPKPGRKKWLIFILTIILSWVLPAIVVVVSVAPDYKNYTDDQFCRPSYLPYWLGLILPWGILHVIAYILVFLAFRKSQPINTSASSNEKTTWMREQTGLLLAIVSFDIAWGFGLPTLQYSETIDNSMRSAFQIVFIVFSILLGVVVFLFFCLLSRTVRNKIIQLFGNTIPGKSKTYSPQAFTDQHPVEENVYEMAAKPEAKGESPASPASMDEKPTFAAYILSNPMTEEDNHDGANGVGGEDREKGVESSPEFEEEFTKF